MTLRDTPRGLRQTHRVEVRCPNCRGDGEILYRECDGSEGGVECCERCSERDGAGVVWRETLVPDRREED